MKLSTKEQQIFDLNALCLSREELCKRLKITRATLNTHMNNIASKLVMPEQMNIQYFLACLKLKELQKRQSELERLLNECNKRAESINQSGADAIRSRGRKPKAI